MTEILAPGPLAVFGHCETRVTRLSKISNATTFWARFEARMMGDSVLWCVSYLTTPGGHTADGASPWARTGSKRRRRREPEPAVVERIVHLTDTMGAGPFAGGSMT
jgi:hypothetical protein